MSLVEDDRPLTEAELEAREAERVAKLSSVGRQKAAVSNILKPDLKAIRSGKAAPPAHHAPAPATTSPASTPPRAQTRPHVREPSAGSPSHSGVSGSVSPRGGAGGDVPAWKRAQMEKEQAERERQEKEARAREEAARQIAQRVQQTGLSVTIVDDQVPDFISPRSSSVEVVNPHAVPHAVSQPTEKKYERTETFDPTKVPDYVSKPEEKRYERTETFDPSRVPDYVSKPEEKRYERTEAFDPTKVPDYVSKPEHSYAPVKSSYDPASAPDYVTRPSHSYGSLTPAPAPSPSRASAPPAVEIKFCPWCGAKASLGRFCAECGKELAPPASSPSPAPAPAPAYNPPPTRAYEPFVAPSSPAHLVPKVYPAFSVGPLTSVEGGAGHEVAITGLACEGHELRLQLGEGGRRLTFHRIVQEQGSERHEVQSFNLPQPMPAALISARYFKNDTNGTLRIRLSKPQGPLTPAPPEHEICAYTIKGQPGSSLQRVTIQIEQTSEGYTFVPGPPSPYDTFFNVVLNGAQLEFRSNYAVPEADAIKSISGKQSVTLPKTPVLEQLEVRDLAPRPGKALTIYHTPQGQLPPGPFPDADIIIN